MRHSTFLFILLYLKTHFLRDDSGTTRSYTNKNYEYVSKYFKNCEHLRFHRYLLWLYVFVARIHKTRSKYVGEKVLRSFFPRNFIKYFNNFEHHISSLIGFAFVFSAYIHKIRNKFVGQKILRRSFFGEIFWASSVSALLSSDMFFRLVYTK